MGIKIKSKEAILEESINEQKEVLRILEESLVTTIKESIGLLQDKESLEILYDFIINQLDKKEAK